MPVLSPRGRIVRDALIYTPLFVLSAGLLALMLANVVDRAIIGMILLAGMAFLFGYQSVQSLRDLSAAPRTVTGVITRRWTKRDAFVAKSHYITVERAIYRIPVESYLDLLERDTVTIVAYPHTGTVVSVERAARPDVEQPVPSSVARGRLRTLRTARSTPSTRRRDPGEPPVGPDEDRSP